MIPTEPLRREPGNESTPPGGELLSSVLQRPEAPADPSGETKDHFTAAESIASGSLKGLEGVSSDIDKLRDEITLRARMIAEATARLDELKRKAGMGYGTIRNAIEMIREEYAAIPAPEPSMHGVTNQKNGDASDEARPAEARPAEARPAGRRAK